MRVDYDRFMIEVDEEEDLYHILDEGVIVFSDYLKMVYSESKPEGVPPALIELVWLANCWESSQPTPV